MLTCCLQIKKPSLYLAVLPILLPNFPSSLRQLQAFVGFLPDNIFIFSYKQYVGTCICTHIYIYTYTCTLYIWYCFISFKTKGILQAFGELFSTQYILKNDACRFFLNFTFWIFHCIYLVLLFFKYPIDGYSDCFYYNYK